MASTFPTPQSVSALDEEEVHIEETMTNNDDTASAEDAGVFEAERRAAGVDDQSEQNHSSSGGVVDALDAPDLYPFLSYEGLHRALVHQRFLVEELAARHAQQRFALMSPWRPLPCYLIPVVLFASICLSNKLAVTSAKTTQGIFDITCLPQCSSLDVICSMKDGRYKHSKFNRFRPSYVRKLAV